MPSTVWRPRLRPGVSHARPADRPMTDRERQLAADHWPLARRIARDYSRGYEAHLDDLREAADLALIRVAMRWVDDGGGAFATYAKFRIVGAVLDARRRINVRLGRESPGLPTLESVA